MDMKWLDKLNKREKALVIAIATLLALWIIYTVILEPVYNSWARLSKDIDIAKIELQKSLKILKQKEDVTSQYNKSIDKFLAKEGDEEEMALILNEIEVVARKSAVKIINMKPRRIEKGGTYRLFYVDLDTQASMQGVLKFIKALKDSRFSLSVEQITLNSRSSEPTVLNSSITVSRLGINPAD